MALRRRSGGGYGSSVWPGFVDAMSAMLLVLSFVLSIFMITQYALRETISGQEETISGQDAAIETLAARLDALSDILSLERREKAEVENRAQRLSASLADMTTERDALDARVASLTQSLAQSEEGRAELDAALAEERERLAREAAERRAIEALAASLRTELRASESALDEVATQLSEEERARALEMEAAAALRERLASAETELTAMELALDERRKEAEETLTLLAGAEAAREAAQRDLEGRDALLEVAREQLARLDRSTEEEQREVALLNEQTRALRAQLRALQQQLADVETRRAEEAAESAATIEDLGQRLNVALAERNAALEEQVDELERYRSDFFGRVREALSGREDVRIVGDRFVFQSEVLFDPGSADLGEAGRAELSKFAEILNAIAAEIPEDVDWILRIDGHTDVRPVNAARSPYRNNWELSQARALSVAEFLIEQEGVPPDRLAAAGFGEFQPLDPARTADAYARNRRIELKLTER